MTGPWASSTYAGQWAAGAAAAEAARLDDGCRLAVTALLAIEDRATILSRTSARVRSLGLEVLPRGHYLQHRITALRAEFSTSRPHGRSIGRARDCAEEIRSLLDAVLHVTSTIDVAGQLDIPLELVSVSQSGAWAGVASVDRLLGALDEFETGTPVHRSTDRSAPSPAASWLLGLAGLLLPSGSRDRYAEEFGSELRELAEEGATPRAQTAYALRQLVVSRALRRALPAGPTSASTRGRVRMPLDRPMPARTRLVYRLRDWFDEHVGGWAARTELDAQVRAHREERWFRQPQRRTGSPAHALTGHRRRISDRVRPRRR